MPRSELQGCVGYFVVVFLLVLVLAGLTVLTTDYGPPARVTRAQLGCKGIAQAVQAYVTHPDNTKNELPRDLTDLLRPPFGGSAFLQNGAEDLIDPWGKPYQFERRRLDDGGEYLFIWTTAPDGTPISQFGIGKNSRVSNP